jgi:hypothetical protein
MPDQVSPHLEPDVVAAYVERRLSSDALASAEQHLAVCATCRREVAQIVKVLRPPAARRLPALGLAAAAVLVIAVLLVGDDPGDVDTPPVRNGATSPGLQVVAPDSMVSSVSPVFIWRSLEPATRYEFSLADEAGGRIFFLSLSDTVLSLPDSVRLQQGRIYQWLVDALRPDGRSTTTGVRYVRLVP